MTEHTKDKEPVQHFSKIPTRDEFLEKLKENFEKIEKAFQERGEICVTVHILPKP